MEKRWCKNQFLLSALKSPLFRRFTWCPAVFRTTLNVLFHCVSFRHGAITAMFDFAFCIDKKHLIGVESLAPYARRLFSAVRDKNLDCIVCLI